jgi:hypothetical protein
MHRLRDECREHPFSAVLLNTAGERRGRLHLPLWPHRCSEQHHARTTR